MIFNRPAAYTKIIAGLECGRLACGVEKAASVGPSIMSRFFPRLGQETASMNLPSKEQANPSQVWDSQFSGRVPPLTETGCAGRFFWRSGGKLRTTDSFTECFVEELA